MKKIQLIICVFIVVAVNFISACNQPNDMTSHEGSNIGKAIPMYDPYEVKIYQPGPGSQRDADLIDQEATALLKDMNTKIKITCIPNADWYEKKQLIINSGEKADLVFTSSWSEYFEEVGKNYWLPLDNLLNQFGEGITKSLSKENLAPATVNGVLYAVPVSKEFAAVYGLLLNKKLVDNYSIDISSIQSLSDLEPILQKIKDNEKRNGITPFLLDGDGNPLRIFYNNTFETIGSDISVGAIRRNGAEMAVINQYEQPDMLDTIRMVYQWKLKGYFNQYNPNTPSNQTDLRQQGKYFCMTASLKPGKDKEMMQQNGIQLIQTYWSKPYSDTNIGTGAMMSIPKQCQNPQRAMMVLNRIYTDRKLVNVLVNGIEGKHYVVKADNKIDFPAGLDATNSGYLPQNNWQIGNQYLDYIWSMEDADKYTKFGEFNNEAVKSRILGFTYYGKDLKGIEGTCLGIIGDYMNKYGNGIIDPDKTYADFLHALKVAGSDIIIADKQRQLDAWILSHP